MVLGLEKMSQELIDKGSQEANNKLEQSARLARAATYASVGVAGSLIVVKFGAWLLTDSVSLLSTLIDSLLDIAASLVNLVAVRHALTPADREHRFGHGKAEALAALAQATFITGSALFLLFEAISRLFNPQPIAYGNVGIGVMIFSIIATFALVRFQAFVVARTKSLTIKADSLHYLGDLLVNAAVILALVLSGEFGITIADPIFGLAIGLYILRTAWKIARGSYDMLMDRELPDEERAKITKFVLAQPEVRSLHDLRSRASGPQTFIQMHIELDGAMSLFAAHEVAERIERELIARFSPAEVIIHQDPVMEADKLSQVEVGATSK